jgi:DNA-binding beta-propeller fold protein YncE
MTLTAFDPKGKVKWVAGQTSTTASESNRLFGLPAGVDLDEKGNVYVIDSFHFTIQVYSPGGQRLAETGTMGDGPGAFYFPRGIAVAPNGMIYVADSNNGRVQALKLKRFEIVK